MSNLNSPSSNKQRLDTMMVKLGLAETRSAAGNWIALGRVMVDGRVAHKSGVMVDASSDIKLDAPQRYVSRAGLKLASVANKLSVQFDGATVLDVGSSTGGFTDYALQNGAAKVYAVDVGTDQMHPSLRNDSRIELYEKTDIRELRLDAGRWTVDGRKLSIPGIIVIDVSFISIREVLSHLAHITPSIQPRSSNVQFIAMVKPQFEAARAQLTKTGIVKNDRHRRQILADFEAWAKQYFVVEDKADSDVAGAGGNLERFYKLRLL